MKWKKLTLTVNEEAADLVCDMLNENGIDGVEIIDNIPITEEERKKMFIDILPELEEGDKTAKINFYADEDDDLGALIEKVKNGLEELKNFIDVGSGEIVCSETEDKDWIDNWKQYFKPFKVDDTIVIKPTWEEYTPESKSEKVIEIDPGTAFGTGSHETTRLCILNIKENIKKGAKVLDIGTGSGILSIIARKFGASYVIGTDIDEIAVKVAGENTTQNKIETAVSYTSPGVDFINDTAVISAADRGCGFYKCDLLSDNRARKLIGDDYDIVVANILADVIMPLSKVVGEFLKPNGIFISSGIINTKADDVEKAIIENNMEIVGKKQQGDWVSFVARKKTQEAL